MMMLTREQKQAIFDILSEFDGRTWILSQLIKRGVIAQRKLDIETDIRDLFRELADDVK